MSIVSRANGLASNLREETASIARRGVGIVRPAQSIASSEATICDELERRRLQTQTRQPGNPVADGFKVYSQCDEDGILESILRQIPSDALSHTCVEIGASDGLENNTHYLLLKGYRGVWVEGSEVKVQYLRERLPLPSERLMVDHLMISQSNAESAAAKWGKFLGTTTPDVLSLDIDGPDYSVLSALLTALEPRVLIVEYNAKFPPTLALAASSTDSWSRDDYYGASLKAFVQLLDQYRLVGCSQSGVNAFFVLADLAGPFGEYAVEELYSPARHYLVHHSSGHSPTLRWLAQALGGSQA